MNKRDLPAFERKLWHTLGKYPSFRPDEITLASYWDELERYDLEAVVEALTKAPLACANKEFAPSAPMIAEITVALQRGRDVWKVDPLKQLEGRAPEQTTSTLGDTMKSRMETLIADTRASKGEFTHDDGLNALKCIQQELTQHTKPEKRATLPQERRQPITRYHDGNSAGKTKDSIAKKVLEPMPGLVSNALRGIGK